MTQCRLYIHAMAFLNIIFTECVITLSKEQKYFEWNKNIHRMRYNNSAGNRKISNGMRIL